jgi:hypothetical protein
MFSGDYSSLYRRWKEVSRVKRVRSTLLSASVKGLKRMVEGGTWVLKSPGSTYILWYVAGDWGGSQAK